MKKIIYIIFCFILFNNNSFSQSMEELKYFKIPLVVDESEFSTDFIASVYFKNFNKTPLNEKFPSQFKNDEGKILLSIFKSLQTKNYSQYKSISTGKDSIIDDSYKFYTIYFSLSKAPKVFYKYIIGCLNLYFIELDEHLPLITIGLYNKNGQLKNAPEYINNPMIASLSKLSNSLSDKILFVSAPIKNTTVTIDSMSQGNCHFPLKYYFDSYKLFFNAANNAVDSLNKFPKQFEELLMFYKKSIQLLTLNDTANYFSCFTNESKKTIRENLNKNDTSSYQNFKNYKLSFLKINHIISFGNVYILFYKIKYNGKNYWPHSYVVLKNNKYYFTNENYEFYLDDLLKTKSFTKILDGQ